MSHPVRDGCGREPHIDEKRNRAVTNIVDSDARDSAVQITKPEERGSLLAAAAGRPGPVGKRMARLMLGTKSPYPVSGSAALGVGAELIATYGPDSLIGRTAAVMLGSTETTFYTIAVYFGAAGIVKTRYAVPAALCADLAGFMAAAWAVRVIFY